MSNQNSLESCVLGCALPAVHSDQDRPTVTELCKQSLPPGAALAYALDSIHAGINRNLMQGHLLDCVRDDFAMDHTSISAWLAGIGESPLEIPSRDVHLDELLRSESRSLLRAYLRNSTSMPQQSVKCLHLRAASYGFRGFSAKRALEQELLMHSQREESWSYHRCRWHYREVQKENLGDFLNATDATRHARSGQIYFHPDQLKENDAAQWPALRRMLDSFRPGFLRELISKICTYRHLEIRIPLGSWALIRPLLHYTFGGQDLPFLELPGNSILNNLPPCPEGLHGMMVLHLSKEVSTEHIAQGLETYERKGWKVLLVHDGDISRVNSLPQVTNEGNEQGNPQGFLTPKAGSILPLREFVRRMERRYIHDVLGLHEGVKTRACESLAITRQTLYAKLGKEK
jgi:hypothetical protein